jgi:hypothetical protein
MLFLGSGLLLSMAGFINYSTIPGFSTPTNRNGLHKFKRLRFSYFLTFFDRFRGFSDVGHPLEIFQISLSPFLLKL